MWVVLTWSYSCEPGPRRWDLQWSQSQASTSPGHKSYLLLTPPPFWKSFSCTLDLRARRNLIKINSDEFQKNTISHTELHSLHDSDFLGKWTKIDIYLRLSLRHIKNKSRKLKILFHITLTLSGRWMNAGHFSELTLTRNRSSLTRRNYTKLPQSGSSSAVIFMKMEDNKMRNPLDGRRVRWYTT